MKNHHIHLFRGIVPLLLAGFAISQGPLAARAAEPATNGLNVAIARTTNGAIQLDWTALAGAQGYRVEYRGPDEAAWQVCPPASQWPQTGNQWLDPQAATGNRWYRVVAFPGGQAQRGRVLATNGLRNFTPAEVNALFAASGIPAPLTPKYTVTAMQVVYETISARGEKTQASGALVWPLGAGKSLPLASYQHGTLFLKSEAPSYGQETEFVIGVALASIGYATVLPDYLGLGQSPGRHPYVHARSEATAVVDMLRAGRTVCGNQQVALNGQLFLLGYSQGGHATMAAHRELEASHASEFQITASAPMAGPYDISGTMYQLMISTQAYADPAYLPYTLFSYNDAYQIYNPVSQALAAPYDTTLWPLFDGLHGSGDVNAVMPSVPSQILRPDFLQAFKADASHPFRLALQDNDLYNWTPRSPMRMFHCHGDRTVPFANSQIAFDHFQANGANQVELVDPFPLADHGTGAYFCLIGAKDWFETLRR